MRKKHNSLLHMITPVLKPVLVFIYLLYWSSFVPDIWLKRLAHQCSRMVLKSFTNVVTISSGPPHVGFLSGCTWDGIPATWEWSWDFPRYCLFSSHHYAGCLHESQIFLYLAYNSNHVTYYVPEFQKNYGIFICLCFHFLRLSNWRKRPKLLRNLIA